MSRGRLLSGATLAGAMLIASGCGVTHLQTARTVPAGTTRTTIAASVAHLGDRGFDLMGIPAVPLDLMVRHGASDRVDWGVRLFFGLGLLGDVKWSLLAPERRTALAASAGLGGAFDTGRVLHVPLKLTVSHAVRAWFTPYGAIGYGAFWIFDYGDRDPGVDYASRSGTGDGLLLLHAGVELARASGRALFLEYSYARPVVNDPGDFYGFATNQFFSIGFRTGSGSALSR